MELLKLLLVDDEAIILRGLTETYDWERMGYEVVATAGSGEHALALIEDEEPDVVITDVRMKKISGLELIERTKLSHPEIKFIVVSAYKDFEYAKRACQGGALSYLVKPIDDQELAKIMQKAYEACMEEKKKSRTYENWRRILVDHEDSFLTQTIERYVKDEISAQELNSLAEALSKESGFQNFYVAVCADIDIIHKVTNQVEFDLKRYCLFTELEKKLSVCGRCHKYTNSDGSSVFLVALEQAERIHDLKNLMEEIKNENEFQVIAAISNAYAGLGGMKTAYKQGIKLYEIACEAGAGMLLVSKDAQLPIHTQYFSEVENQIVRAVRKNTQEGLKSGFEDLVYSLPSDENTAKTYLHRLAVQVEVILDDSYALSDNIRMGFSNFYGMLEQYNLIRLIDILYKLLGTVIEERMTSAPVLAEQGFGDYMKAALTYIEEHIQEEELSITVVADHVFLNPVYFGRLFKNVMGMTFKRYILHVRMDWAKKLILKSHGSIGEIGVKVGIPNPSYFSQLFKQETGMLPSEYKKEHET